MSVEVPFLALPRRGKLATRHGYYYFLFDEMAGCVLLLLLHGGWGCSLSGFYRLVWSAGLLLVNARFNFLKNENQNFKK